MASNPTIFLVPGGFHVASHMALLRKHFEEASYPVVSTGLKTVNGPTLTIQDDVDYLQKEILHPLIREQGKEVVLYLQSYAGFPGSAAIEDFSKADRLADGKEGGIVGLVYQSAFVPKEGGSLIGMNGGNPADWWAVNMETGLINVIDPKTVFYHDLPASLAGEASATLLGQSLRSVHTASGPVFYATKAYDGRRLYIFTEQDQALPSFVQDMFLANSGAEWEVRRIMTGHSPFLNEPAMITEIVSEAAKKFAATY